MVTWRDLGNAVTFELHGKPKNPDSWIAIAFSNDIRMVSMIYIFCFQLTKVGKKAKIIN